MDEFARDALDLEYYWGRVEFAPGRGAIHLHILGIAKKYSLMPSTKLKLSKIKLSFFKIMQKSILA